jgi:hypothetical protein
LPHGLISTNGCAGLTPLAFISPPRTLSAAASAGDVGDDRAIALLVRAEVQAGSASTSPLFSRSPATRDEVMQVGLPSPISTVQKPAGLMPCFQILVVWFSLS